MASEKVLNLNDNNFDQAVSGVTLIDFWAPWCGPCRMQGPIIDNVAEKVGDAAKVAKVDVDQAPGLANKFGVSSIPTLVVLKDGKVYERFVGVQPEGKLVSALLELTTN